MGLVEKENQMGGRIDVVGIGPGARRSMTYEATQAIAQADVVIGYTTYIRLIQQELSQLPEIKKKAFISTPMRGEVERCRRCFDEAKNGKRVALVCSGDAGIYGMASLIWELSTEYEPCEIHVVSGVTAATAGAALVGAPLGHDFCVISLSDLLTPWEVIERRLQAACEGDLCIVIYNPASRGRADYPRRACEILLPRIGSERPCAIARNISREGESAEVLTLGELSEATLDMFSTIFIGNSKSRVIGGRLVTPRGYRYEEDAAPSRENSKKLEKKTCPVIFSGTTEGRRLSEGLSQKQIFHVVCVATPYGKEMMKPNPFATVLTGRMDSKEMSEMMRERGSRWIFDATHPFATEVSANIRSACQKVNATYIRVLRKEEKEDGKPDLIEGFDKDNKPNPMEVFEGEDFDDKEGVLKKKIRFFSTTEALKTALLETEGNILLTTGSKELEDYAKQEAIRNRLYVRVLPSVEAITLCERAGIHASRIIAMHGPFSQEMNEALIRQYDIRVLVSKESGQAGGFDEKRRAAAAMGISLFVLRRPYEKDGMDWEKALRWMCSKR